MDLSKLVERRRKLEVALAKVNSKIDVVLLRLANRKQKHWQFELSSSNCTIRWDAGEVKLTETCYQVVSALFAAEEHRLATGELCEKVWGDAGFMRHSLYKTLQRTNKLLRDGAFPYQVRPYRDITEAPSDEELRVLRQTKGGLKKLKKKPCSEVVGYELR